MTTRERVRVQGSRFRFVYQRTHGVFRRDIINTERTLSSRTSDAVAATRRIVIALSLLHAVFGMSLALRAPRSPIGIVQASVGSPPGWMLFLNLRPTNTHAWAYHHIRPSMYEPPDAVQLNIWTLDLTHASFVQYLALELPLDRTLGVLVACHMSIAFVLLALLLMVRMCQDSVYGGFADSNFPTPGTRRPPADPGSPRCARYKA
jgi:hypothetical protein